MSDTVATDERGGVSGVIKARTRRALDNLAATLWAAGSRLEHAAKVFVYLRSREFTGDLPARTMVGTGLIVPEGLVEIMLTAVK
ncbi:MAG: RidA family protein [Candidatus Rokubacteria bacterium]|nr:RidA family protein [Candidatus Rokubacteria bacterium]